MAKIFYSGIFSATVILLTGSDSAEARQGLARTSAFTLRQAQGERSDVKIVGDFPFVLSLSKHEYAFSTVC